jgi:hypothetical protein
MYVDSYPSDLKPSPVIFRLSLSTPADRSGSLNSLHPEGGKALRTTQSNTTIVNKLVSDVRKSLNNTNLFKPFNKRPYTNEVDEYAIFFSHV